MMTILLPSLCQADLFPNGDFESGSTSWSEVTSGPGFYTFSYPSTGGNTDGYGIIDATQASDQDSFGAWVGNGDDFITLRSLGLRAGFTYLFTQDMILLAGDNLGRLKIDFFTGTNFISTTNKLSSDLIGDGNTWETYQYEIEIPAGVDQIKIVPESGASSSVGFDNISFDPTPILPPIQSSLVQANSAPQLAEGTLVSWIPTNLDTMHQPQSSQDNITWFDLGPAFLGTDTTTILDPNSAPFHRVVETDPAGQQALINGDFEIADGSCAQAWTCLGSQDPTRIETDDFSGSASMRLAAQNDDGGDPNNSEIQQNLINAGGFVIPGETYTFSFMARQVSFGVSWVQTYRLQWLDSNNAVIEGASVGFNPIPEGDGTWTEVSIPNLVAPAQAVGVFIQIFGATGAVPGASAQGEILIDNLSLSLGGTGEFTILATTSEPGIGITQLAQSGVTYKAQESEDLQNFTDLTGTFIGNGQIMGAGIPDGGPSHFFRLLEISPIAN